MDPIQFSGISDLNDEERQVLKDVTTKNYGKIRALMKSEQTSVLIHIKTYREKKNGEKKKYSVTIKVTDPTNLFRSGTSDWTLGEALHAGFDKITREIKSKFRLD